MKNWKDMCPVKEDKIISSPADGVILNNIMDFSQVVTSEIVLRTSSS